MTTFTSEDRISSTQYFTDPGILSEPTQKIWSDVDKAWWGDTDPYQLNLKNIRQAEIEFFFPLTEQIPLGLDYGPSDLLSECYKSKYTISSQQGTNICWGNTTISNITPTLSVQPNNPVGQLNIGGIQVGLEKSPTWYQKVVYKLLGFNWKDK